MSKEVENNKINISKELLKKQVFDSIILAIIFGAVFYFVKFAGYCSYDILIVLMVAFLIFIALSHYSKNAVKKPLDRIVVTSCRKTIEDISSIQNKNNYQKENNLNSQNKINMIQTLISSLKDCSNEMNEITLQINDKANQSLNFTNNEYNAIKTNIEKMFSIRHKIQTIAELILELSDFVQSISSTIGLVEDIAEQTNLLALNAAVEAARAGEHGKGFAVVASEIRKLADESKQATTKIISLINDIQQTANSTVLATEEGTKEIESGLEHAHIISENIEQLINAMSEISANMNSIIVSSKKINNDSNVTSEYLKEISEIVDNNAKLTTENDSIFEQIETTSNDLKQSVI